MSGKMVTIRLSEKNAKLLAQSIDGWRDAGACEGGLTQDEMKALDSAFNQLARQVYGRKAGHELVSREILGRLRLALNEQKPNT